MSVKINRLALENVKRVRAVQLEPTANGLTVIGGRNGQGKTSVLDAIAWALGGEKYRPTKAEREGSVLPPDIRVELNNGIVVERKGKNSALKVTDPTGSRRGQKLLDEFVEQLALNLPKFMEASDKEKAGTLLQIIGVGDRLAELERQEAQLYQERLAVGRVADQKAKYAAEMPQYDGVPEDIVSASELIRQQQDILARNGENARKRARLNEITFEKHRIYDEIVRLEDQVIELNKRIQERKKVYEQTAKDEEVARTDALKLHDESTAELEANIAQIDEINAKVRANLDRAKAVEDAKQYTDQYNGLTVQIDQVRGQKRALLDGAALPLPGLGVENGALTYNGQAWDCMSSSEQLRVATAIVRKLNPECGFVLVDKLEQMDPQTMRKFGEWLEAEGLQVIATRVTGSGEDCTIVIEDGMVAGDAGGLPQSPSATAPSGREPFGAQALTAPSGREPEKPTFEMGVF
jgi:hypothetical protein